MPATPMYRILVVRLGSMGDVIHALPAVATLKNSFPESHLSWVVKPRWMPLLAGNPFVDAVIPFERTGPGIARLWGRIRREPYRLAVDLQGLIQSGLIVAAAKAERRVGLEAAQAREPQAAWFYSTTVRTQAVHRVDSYLEIATAAGAKDVVRQFPLPQGSPEGELPAGDFVLASPFAGWGAKQWPVAYYSELARMISSAIGLPLVVNGPSSAQAVLAGIDGAHVHLSGIEGLIHATRRARAVIGVDSGPLHLAAALGKPGVAIYGPTDPALHGPYALNPADPPMWVLRDVNARTTYKRDEAIDPAMRAVTPAQAMEGLKGSLQAAAARRSA